jgi:glutamine synthetase
VKTIALQHGLFASFMPKPLYKQNGSGMHVHQSLALENGRNAFDDPDGEYGLSDIAMKYLGGLLAHSKEICAILNSHVNSFKRLVPGYEAPCYISWANMTRSARIRLPAGRGRKARMELRNPDPAGNFYLQFAMMIAAGLDGIEKNIMPPDPIEKDIFHMDKEERERNGNESLPESLGAALEVMSQSELVRKTLGDHTFNHYLTIKGKDWDAYRSYITDWELQRYLSQL